MSIFNRARVMAIIICIIILSLAKPSYFDFWDKAYFLFIIIMIFAILPLLFVVIFYFTGKNLRKFELEVKKYLEEYKNNVKITTASLLNFEENVEKYETKLDYFKEKNNLDTEVNHKLHNDENYQSLRLLDSNTSLLEEADISLMRKQLEISNYSEIKRHMQFLLKKTSKIQETIIFIVCGILIGIFICKL